MYMVSSRTRTRKKKMKIAHTVKNKHNRLTPTHPTITLMARAQWTTPDTGLEVYTNIAEPALFPANAVIAGFDLDGTLITTKSGRVFPRDRNDWRWLADEVPAALKRLADPHGNTLLAIITNQSKFTADLRHKIEDIVSAADLVSEAPFIVLVSTEHTRYRKPMRGAMDWLRATYKVSPTGGFYVGDAMSPTLGDHSTSDYYFALNAGLAFHYASNYWGISKPPVPVPPPMLPPGLQDTRAECETTKTAADKVAALGWDVVILVGAPAVGKSTLAAYLRDYWDFTIVSMDTDGTKAAYTRRLKTLLSDPKHPRIVIDNTNPDRDELFAVIAKERTGAVTGTVWFDVDRATAEYMNHRRCYMTGRWIPAIAYNMYYKKLVPPTNKGGNMYRFVPCYEDVTRDMYY